VTHGRKWLSENVGYREARCIFGKKKEKKRHTDYFPVKQLLLKLFQSNLYEQNFFLLYLKKAYNCILCCIALFNAKVVMVDCSDATLQIKHPSQLSQHPLRLFHLLDEV
jgi:hypothetical protein